MATITPFVKRMRTQGGTIYTFSSALEDIGLNINERNNVVKMSHYALLNVPAIDVPPDNIQQNRFNVLAIPGAYESFLNSGSIKDGRVIIAESFQNYALNLETNLLAQTTYNPALSNTVTERVFWKWLKETGAIRWNKFDTSAGTYWKEENDTDSSSGYNSIVKCIGQISAGSVRTNTFGTYNETYVLVPTSFGQTPVYFKQLIDDNYHHGMSILNGNTNILGRETYLQPHPDGLDYKAYYDLADSSTAVGANAMKYDNSVGSYTTGWWWTAEGLPLTSDNNYYTDTDAYLSSGIYNVKLKYDTVDIEFLRSKVDCLAIEYDINKLKSIFKDTDSNFSFDSLAIKYAEDDQFDFNAVLIYYSVYNKALDTILATNLLGVLFLDAPSGNTSDYPISEISIPSITKLQSGPSGFGTSYSFRLNVKSDYMLDDTAAIIVDNASSSQLVIDDFTQVFDSLSKTLAILNGQTGTLSYITEQYLDITSNQTNLINQVASLTTVVNNVTKEIQGTENVITMFSAGSDPLVESSIYMKDGNVGFFTNTPQYPIQMDKTLKTKEIIIENSIKDASGNVLLGYGSPLQLGSSTNFREINFFTGNSSYGLKIDTSNNVFFGDIKNASTGYTVYYDPTTKKLTYALAPSGGGGPAGITWTGGHTDNYIVTANTDGTISSEAGLTFSSNVLKPAGNYGVKLQITAGDYAAAGAGGNLILQAGSNTAGGGGDVHIEAGHGNMGAASYGQIFIGMASTNAIFMGGIVPFASNYVVHLNPSTGQLYYSKDASLASIISIEASIGNINTQSNKMNVSIGLIEVSVGNLNTISRSMNSSIGIMNASLANIDSSIQQLDSAKAPLVNPQFSGSFGTDTWVFEPCTGHALVLRYGTKVMFKFYPDGSIGYKTGSLWNDPTL